MNDSLSDIEKKINQRIQQLKDKMKKTNQRTETDRLWIRIETLQWTLAQILGLRG
jgi:polyhydroxyalkanoate synthesis regulator phasin